MLSFCRNAPSVILSAKAQLRTKNCITPQTPGYIHKRNAVINIYLSTNKARYIKYSYLVRVWFMYSRLKFLSLMSVGVILSLSISVYGKTPSRLLAQTPSSLAQNSTTEADRLFEQGVQLYRIGRYLQQLGRLPKKPRLLSTSADNIAKIEKPSR